MRSNYTNGLPSEKPAMCVVNGEKWAAVKNIAHGKDAGLIAWRAWQENKMSMRSIPRSLPGADCYLRGKEEKARATRARVVQRAAVGATRGMHAAQKEGVWRAAFAKG
jgi:hypothetical protein